MKDPKALFSLSYGLFVLTAHQGDKDNGCIINTAMQVTDTPTRLVVAVNKDSCTHDMILFSGQFNLSVLSEEADFELIRRFGFQSGRDADKFSGFEAHTLRGQNGVVYIAGGTNAWISCRVISAMDLGSHTLFLADVEDADTLTSAPSATYSYYQAHIKPKAPVQPKKKSWVCRVCGYVYEGEALPADFICPICKHPASDFEVVEG